MAREVLTHIMHCKQTATPLIGPIYAGTLRHREMRSLFYLLVFELISYDGTKYSFEIQKVNSHFFVICKQSYKRLKNQDIVDIKHVLQTNHNSTRRTNHCILLARCTLGTGLHIHSYCNIGTHLASRILK